MPTLNSVSPSVVPIGWNGTLTVSGYGFSPSHILAITSGGQLPTTYVDAYTLKATLPCCITSYAATYGLFVITPGVSIISNRLAFIVGTPPVITGLSPNSATVGGPGVTITVTGSGFQPGAIAYILDNGANATALSTTYVSPLQLTALLPASYLAGIQPTVGGVQVKNPDKGFSGETSFWFNAAPPAITSIAPSSLPAGGLGFTLTVNGSNFYNGAAITWNQVQLQTTFLSPSMLTAVVPASYIQSPGTAQIAVLNSVATGNTTSASLPFTSLAPTLTSVNPSSAFAGSPALTVSALGAGFVNNSSLEWAGSLLPATVANAGQLSATVPSNLLAMPGKVTVMVLNGPYAPSGPLSFTINPPSVSAVNPPSVAAGSPASTFTVNGAGFFSGSQVYWNNTGLPTSYLSGTALSAVVSADMLAAPGTAKLSVVNVGGAASNPSTVSLYPPSITSLAPASALTGSPALTLTVSGAGFLPASVVEWNGNPLPTAYTSSSQLTAAVAPSLLASPGAIPVTVSNSGAAVSAPATFTVGAGVPTVSGILPPSVAAGGPAFTLQVDGSGFFAPARILWNSAALDTTWIDAGRLRASVPAALIAQPGAAAISVATAGGVSNSLSLAVRPAGPYTSSAGIVNAASGSTSIAPGSLVAIFGANLSAGTDSAAATPLPLSLADTSVTIGGIPAPLLYVSPSQINLQMPFEIAPGYASVIVSSGGISGDPVAVNVLPFGPGIVMVPQSNHAMAVNYADGSLNSAANPAHPGDYLVLYLTGQGALDNPVASGSAAPSAPLSRPLADVSVQIGGQPASVAFAGLAPGLVGVFQINLAVPAVPAGEQPLVVTLAGSPANPAVVSVQ